MKLVVGIEYYLDETKKDTGIFVKQTDTTTLFSRAKGRFYVEIEGNDENKGLIPFEIKKTNYKPVK